MLLSFYTQVWPFSAPPLPATPWPQLFTPQQQPGGSLLLLLYTALASVGQATVPVSGSRAIYASSGAEQRSGACDIDLEPMDLADIDDVPFIFEDLQPGERIVSFQVEVSVDAGNADASPQSLAVGMHAVGSLEGRQFYLDADGRVVLQRFGARIRGTVYGIRGTATLSSGRRITAAATLGVTKKGTTACLC